MRKDYINIDIQPPFDVQHDLRTPLPYADNSVDEIFSWDVIQMFTRKEWQFVKKDWFRVLRPMGRLNVGCWDFAWALRTFLLHPEDPYNMQRIYAGQDNEFDCFKNGFTYEILVADLKEEGFINFERLPNPDYFINLKCEKSCP